MKIAYFTPRFGGFGIGVSHTPDLTNSDAPGDHVAGDHSQTDGIVTFERKLGDVDVKADVGWNHDHGRAVDNTGWRAGINLGLAGFTIGGSYLDQGGDAYRKNDNDGDEVAGLVSPDGNSWDMGISYKSGPWTAAVAYMETEGTDYHQ